MHDMLFWAAAPSQVQSAAAEDHDFQGCYTAVLHHHGQLVAAVVLRVFGQGAAELPLVGTDPQVRREGHCRALMTAVEGLLREAQVRIPQKF